MKSVLRNMYSLFNMDSLVYLSELENNSIDCIITDPPYFLSNGGLTCKSGRFVSVDKGDWDRLDSIQDISNFNLIWLNESLRILKEGGTLWVSGTFHNIYNIGNIIQNINGFKFLNNITWIKKSPPPNLSCRFFTHSTETILWVRKGIKSKHYFNYELMKKHNSNKQMKDYWIIGRPKKEELIYGKHPTQKPEELIERMILSSTKKDDVVLDMFCGSGTVGSVCLKNNRRFIGIEINDEYYELSKKRLNSIIDKNE